MKLLPQNKKRVIIYAAIFVVCIGGIIYLNVFQGGSQPSAIPSYDAEMAGAPMAEQGVSVLLPFGSKIDKSILSDSKFQALKSAPTVTVTAEELGKLNLFEK